MDEFTRAGLAREVATSWPSPRVLALLEPRVTSDGPPEFIRRDHGPECMALAVRGWLAQHQLGTRSLDPGGPWPHGYGERFHGTVRHAWLHMHLLPSVGEARGMLAAYRRQDHEARPHRS
jgi:putative transposase